MTRMVRRSMVLATLAGVALGALPSIAMAADHAVAISGFAFAPETVTVSVGDTVTWSNSDAANHTATADDGSFDTGTISSGSTKSVTFSAAGTFAYHCTIHASMTATVVVQGAGASAPPTDTEPTAASSRAVPAWFLMILAGLAGAMAVLRRLAPASSRR